MLLSSDVLWAISLSPVVLVALILAALFVIGVVQRSAEPPSRAEVAEYWEVLKRTQNGKTFGTQETPVVPTISLITATLTEALDYLAAAQARRQRDHLEFLTLMGGRTA